MGTVVCCMILMLTRSGLLLKVDKHCRFVSKIHIFITTKPLFGEYFCKAPNTPDWQVHSYF